MFFLQLLQRGAVPNLDTRELSCPVHPETQQIHVNHPAHSSKSGCVWKPIMIPLAMIRNATSATRADNLGLRVVKPPMQEVQKHAQEYGYMICTCIYVYAYDIQFRFQVLFIKHTPIIRRRPIA